MCLSGIFYHLSNIRGKTHTVAWYKIENLDGASLNTSIILLYNDLFKPMR